MIRSDATRFSLVDVIRHGLTTMAFCCAIAAALTISGRGRWDVQLVYSLSIGLISFAVIDIGWWLLARGEGKFWSRGWQAAALVVMGTSAGFVVGTAIGDAYTGTSTWALWSMAPTQFVSILVISLIATVVTAYFFYSRGTARALEAQVAVAERNASEAKLKLLETQLEPHMLFNTLANLRVLIASDPPRAIAMLDRLNSYLRATLSGSRALSHPLSAEFDLLRDYLELMAVRMGDRLTYTLDLPDDLRSIAMPPLLLQPLVENAIQHGLEPKVGGGSITVRASRRGGGGDASIAIEVADTGVGLPADSPLPEPGRGFGIAQIRERLASAYGARGGIELVPDAAGGTRATATFPLETGA